MLTEAEARRPTTRIQLRLETIAENTDAVVPMIEEARDGNAHEVLGYPSWTKYVADKFGGTLARLGKAERVPFVELMAEHGMSTRAIASVVGTSHQTVANDLAVAPVKKLTLADADAELRRPPSRKAVAIREAHRSTTGLDGKTYKRPEPAPPRRRPLPDAYTDATDRLNRVMTSLANLHKDDRFTSNRDSVKGRNGRYLARAANELLDMLDELGLDRHQYPGGRHD